MVDNIKEIGARIKCTEKELLLGLQVNCMRDNIMRIRSMGLENLRNQMGPIMKAVGYLDSVTVVELLPKRKEQKRKVNGVKTIL